MKDLQPWELRLKKQGKHDFAISETCNVDDSERREDDEFTCRIVTHTEELASIYIYICYSTGELFNTPLSAFITSTCGQSVGRPSTYYYCSKPSTKSFSVRIWYKVFVYWR